MRSIRLFLFAAFLAFTPAAFSKGSGGHASRLSSAARSHGSSRSSKCVSCIRNTQGKIARSSTAKHQFEKSHPCPSTGRSSGACPDYVVDHKTPLKRGGADDPSNMQWQSKVAAKAKDKIE
jgi:hypothetical protein